MATAHAIPVIEAREIDALRPGSKAWIRRAFTDAKGRDTVVSIGVVRGARPGPVLAQIAGQHGTEHTGPLVLRDFFLDVDPAEVAGRVYVCPCANPRALELDYEVYPEFHDLSQLDDYYFSDARPGYCVFGLSRGEARTNLNMNRIWPDGQGHGSGDPGITGQIVRWLWDTMIVPADIVVDHHALRADKPLVYCEDPAVPWAPFLGLEAVYTRPMPATIDPYLHGVLPLQANLAGKVGLCIEYSRQHGVKQHELALGRFSIDNLMRAMGMLPGSPAIPHDIWLIRNRFTGSHFHKLAAMTTGHVHFRVREYEPVRMGQTLAEIRDLDTHDLLEEITAPADALVLSLTWRPVSKPGEEVCRVQTDATLLARAGSTPPVPPLR